MSKAFKLSWRMGLETTQDEKAFARFLDKATENGRAADEIWIFMAEPTTYGYDPLPNIARYCEKYQKPAAAARARGIRVGINPWPTFGAGESYQADAVKREMPFQTMVGMDGVASQRAVCPISPEFLAYTRERYMLYAKAGCDFVWVDDDCRFTHLGGAQYPCFCPRCVAGFQNGAFADRETLVAALNAPQNDELRRAWSHYGAERLAKYCECVRAAVDEVDPKIDTNFMSVGYSHTTYSGDYIELCMKALRAKAGRPGHGFYWDENPVGMFEKAMEMSRQVYHMPESVLDDVQYEEESCPSTPLNKAHRTRALEMALALWGGCTGVAFNHFFQSSGPHPFDHLNAELEELKVNRPFFDRYLEFARDLPQAGVWPAESEFKMARMKVGEKGWFDEDNAAYDINKLVKEWPVFGIPVCCDPEHAYATLFQGKIPEIFDKAELDHIFGKPVLMDGLALETLAEMGEGDRAGVKIARKIYGAGETIAPSAYDDGFAGESHSGIMDVTYLLEAADPDVERLADGAAFGVDAQMCVSKRGTVAVLGYSPYRFTGTPGYQIMMRNMLVSMGAPVYVKPADPYALARMSTWARTDGHRAAILLINASLDPAAPFDVCVKGDMTKASALAPGMAETEIAAKREGEFLAARVDGMAPWEMKLVLFE